MDKRRGKSIPPGTRAIQASGDGLWELDLASGAAWFSDWFHTRLGWRPEEGRQTWASLRSAMTPGTWQTLLEEMRGHLECDTPFDLELPLYIGGNPTGWWRFHGRAERNERRHPMYFAGCARDVTAERALRVRLRDEISWLRDAFEAMPVAAAVVDEEEIILEVNRRWRDLAPHISTLREQGGIGGTLQRFMSAAGIERARAQRRALGGDGRRTLILCDDNAHASVSREALR